MKVIIWVGAILFFFSCSPKIQVDTIIVNSKIYTVDTNFSIAEAMSINDGKILELGSNKLIKGKYKSVNVINSSGKYIFPGFIDAHCHFTGFASDMWKCNLFNTKSFSEIINLLIPYSKSVNTFWIYGRGWDQNTWADKEFPDKSFLDSLFPNRPVFLKRIDGHAALVNSEALRLAGINETTEIAGGSIEKRNGKLTGILLDNAMDVVDKIIPQPNDSLVLNYFKEAQRLCLSVGLTGVHDCGITEHTFDLLKHFEANDDLKIKVFALLSDTAAYYDHWLKQGIYESPKLKMGGFKIYSDGALGSRGACLIEDYSDKPGWKGFMLSSISHFRDVAFKLINSNFQMCTHAIGDSANREILKIYAEVLKGKNDRRWRIEHAQVIDSQDFHFFHDYSIIPSIQPTHAVSDMQWAETRLGAERIKYAYAYKALLQQNLWMPLGTDFPVEDIDPLKTFYAAVFRESYLHNYAEPKVISKEDAIRGMTIWAAKAAFQENEKGSLEPGKAADFVILDTDLMKCPAGEIFDINLLETYINGQREFLKQ